MTPDIKKYLIFKNATIQESLNSLNKSGSKCLVVINSKKKILGTLSDGDLRKAILKGKKLSDKISNIFNKNSKYLKSKDFTKLKAQNLFINFLIDIIPIIDDNKKIINIIKIDDIFEKEKNKKSIKKLIPVVIMAGGKGTRLQPFTSILPKPLIPINGKPIIDHIIEKFNEFGIKDYFLSINYKSRILKAFFEESNKKNRIKFIEEKKPLGTIGCLSMISKNIKSNFFVTNCDIIIDCDYNDLLNYHIENKNSITVVASFRNYTVPYGDCKIGKNGLLNKIDEKPSINLLANTGMYVMNKEVIKYIPKNTKFDLPQLVDKIRSTKKKVGIFPISEKAWTDIGHWNEYKKAINLLNFGGTNGRNF